VDFLVPERARNYFHTAARIVTPIADAKFMAPFVAAGRKKGSMPLEQSLCRQWLSAIDRGIERDMDDSFNRAIWRNEAIDIDTKPSGERGSNLLLIKLFSLDCRRLDDVVS